MLQYVRLTIEKCMLNLHIGKMGDQGHSSFSMTEKDMHNKTYSIWNFSKNYSTSYYKNTAD